MSDINRLKNSSIIALIVLLVICILPGCTTKAMSYTNQYPIDRALVEEVLNKSGLAWTVFKDTSVGNGNKVYGYKDKNDVTYHIISTGDGSDSRQLSMSSYHNGMPKNTFMEYEKNNRYKMLKAAFSLYEIDRYFETASKDIEEYINNRDGSKNIKNWYSKRIGDIHINVTLMPYYNDNNLFMIRSIIIRNTASVDSFDKVYISGLRKQNVEGSKRHLIESTIKELGEIDSSQTTIGVVSEKTSSRRFARVAIRGKLKDIKELDEVPNQLTAIARFDNVNEEPHIKDYYRAALKDRTGSIKVYIEKGTLTLDELKEDRTHIIIYNIDEKTGVIIKSVKVK